jgi:hypothetical protein
MPTSQERRAARRIASPDVAVKRNAYESRMEKNFERNSGGSPKRVSGQMKELWDNANKLAHKAKLESLKSL